MVDVNLDLVPAADKFLRELRCGRDRAELTARAHAGAVAWYRQPHTTQRYYRISGHRRRGAVERVVLNQFDRHGNRIWRIAKTLLDSRQVRRAVGEAAVACRLCTELSNFAAGGQDCPVRLRRVGARIHHPAQPKSPDNAEFLSDLQASMRTVLSQHPERASVLAVTTSNGQP